MHIEKLSSTQGNQYVNVVLERNEVRDVANALYHVVSGTPTDTDYSDIFAKFSMLFDLVKEGMIQPHTIKRLAGEKLDSYEEKSGKAD